MAFRDEGLAASARRESLERERAGLRAERDALLQDTPRRRVLLPLEAKMLAGTLPMFILASFFCRWVLMGGVSAELAIALDLVTVTVVSLIVVAALLGRLVTVAAPGRAVVLSGRSHVGKDGETRGYRLLLEGRALRFPFLERAEEVDLRPLVVRLDMGNVFTKGGARGRIESSAVVSVSPDPRFIHHAIERFMGRGRAEVATVAAQTLEGGIRSIAARLALVDLRDIERVDAEIAGELEDDFDKLGLRLLIAPACRFTVTVDPS